MESFLYELKAGLQAASTSDGGAGSPSPWTLTTMCREGPSRGHLSACHEAVVLMLVEETVTYLEMTAPDQLRPGRRAPSPVEIDKLDRASWPLLKSTYERIAAPLNWQSRRAGPDAWPDEKWEELLAHPGVQAWIARVGGEVTGLVELEVQPGGDVEIAVFGLVPEFVGKGFGSHLLTLATMLAWNAEPVDGVPVRRVWLHTSSRDHPHAKPNYERRGFRAFRTERRQRELLT